MCYRIRLVVFSESAFVPLVCVTKPALGLEAMKVVRNSVASATTECPSSMTFIRCLFEGDAGFKVGESYLRAVISLPFTRWSSSSN